MRICVRVVPRSSCNSVDRLSENEYRVRLTSAPVEGMANEKLIEILSEYFGVAKSLIAIVGGKSSKIKMVDLP